MRFEHTVYALILCYNGEFCVITIDDMAQVYLLLSSKWTSVHNLDGISKELMLNEMRLPEVCRSAVHTQKLKLLATTEKTDRKSVASKVLKYHCVCSQALSLVLGFPARPV